MDNKWNDGYYESKEHRNIELVDCWLLCAGLFIAAVLIVTAIAWLVKLWIWLFAWLLGA